ncbi:MAG: hypothetical protein H0Z33_13095 [Bacillaceae bacterium]|nr:hypothetical protein [Bacillaceae bacterium]
MSTLLDGHHRATAAYIENKSINCLTIIKVAGYGFSQGKQKPDQLYAGGEKYDFKLFKNPDRIYKYLDKIFNLRKSQLSVEEVEKILNDCRNVWKQVDVPRENKFGKRTYPDYLSIGFSDMAGDVSDERINEVMARRDEDADFELEMIFKKLQLQEPAKAFELAKRIANDANWRVLQEETFRYLASIDSEEVEDKFIKYLVDNDHDTKDLCRKIADEYLNNRNQ